MRRSFKAIFNSIFILLGSLSISLGAQNLSSDTEHLLQEKTYISTDQVVISQDGLFLKTEEGISLITQLNYDENGFFILSNTSFIRP